MKRILIKIFFLLVILFFFDRIFGFFFQKYIFENTFSGESGGSLNYLIKKKKNVDFIILGSSRAKHQIDPNLLNSIDGFGYNAGRDGMKIIYNSVLLDIILNNIKPKVILLQTDAGNYFRDSIINYSMELIPLYPFYDKSKLLQQYADSLSYGERLELYTKMYRFNGKAYNILFNYLKRKSVADDNGFVPIDMLMDTVKEKENTEPSTFDKESKFDQFKLNALNNIIEMCKLNKIKLYFLLLPTYNNTFYRRLSTQKLINYITSKTNERIINMADISDFKNIQAPNNWKDVTHLNKTGAAKLSQYLNAALK